MCLCVFWYSYRLAPEAVFPAAFDDSVKATKYFLTHAAQFHVNPERVAVAGKCNQLLFIFTSGVLTVL